MTIKAIETRYAGCRFRSRLEARWAVFFDHLGYTWEYEPQGFELPTGRYLPDFWLPDAGKWIEVKSSIGAIGHDDWQKMQDFGNQVAMPESKFSIIFSIPDPRQKPTPFIWTVAWVGPVPDEFDDDLTLTADGDKYPRPNDASSLVDGCGHVFAGFLNTAWLPGTEKSDDVKGALVAARSARFEHGESGAPK